jgi:UDP-galactopyranose mutase
LDIEPIRSDAFRAASDTPEYSGKRSDISLLCFSHLRWDFVFQRPQHLMTRFAATQPVIYWEEPHVRDDLAEPQLDVRAGAGGVTVATPHLPSHLDEAGRDAALSSLLDGLIASRPGPFIRWYYTPMMLRFSRHLRAEATVYDCMDELANFRFAPADLLDLERELMEAADVVFTGGYSLYEAKQDRHANIHPFPSSVDRAHFARARNGAISAEDQEQLPRPRFGFYGVVDERMDLELLAKVADARPDWSIVMVGPVVKIDPADLPQRPNISYMGGRDYAQLPSYLAGWDVALMPFAINESTRFISPTKTPEYLAGGKPVVSTPITDVGRHYGNLAAVKIADTAEAFIAACDEALALARGESKTWLAEVDAVLADLSWDRTFTRMAQLIEKARLARHEVVPMVGRGKHYDYLVVGAGFAGSVMAERLAAGSGKRVLVIDRRPHIAGNAYDHLDDAGILIHRYGPHIFHTNSKDVFDYLSRFTDWRPYEHRVLAQVDDKLVPIPINRTTLNELYGLSLKTDEDAAEFLASRAEPVAEIKTSEDVVVSAVGQDLYRKFFRGYTRKQWALDPSELDKAVTSRVPTRTNTDDRYFSDTFQAMPKEGYTKMFERMLDHPNIDVLTGVEYEDVKQRVSYDRLVFTGPVDEFFDFQYGKLPYRCLEFKHETVDTEWFQPVAVVNYPDEAVPYTRITEYKYLTGQEHAKTSITYEFPTSEGDPYYPVPREENQALYKRYEALAIANPDVIFVGRLATYRYYNMDQVVGQALATYRRLTKKEEAEQSMAMTAAE